MQEFLGLPPRGRKPRFEGLTHVIDRGLTVPDVEGLMEVAGGFIDIVKLGWGTGYVTQGVERKVEAYRSHGIPVVVGGTLAEIALARGRFEEFIAWIRDLGLEHIEISDGSIRIDRREKLAIIDRLASTGDFTVLSEVGNKDPRALVAPFRWVQEIREELDAGARYVILEARESGTAGMYRPNGEVREGLIEEIEQDIDTTVLIFEAPQRHQQVWLIKRLGAEVNLGNIQPDDVIGLETLRLGLRADTVGFSVPELDAHAPSPQEFPGVGV